MKNEEIFEIERLLDSSIESSLVEGVKRNLEFIKETLSPMFHNAKEDQFRKERNKRFSRRNFNPRSKLQNLATTLQQAQQYHEEASEEIRSFDRETQDILHAIELLDLSSDELLEYAKRLAEVRQTRRRSKEFVEITEPVYEFVNDNKEFIKKLNQLTGEVQRKIETIDARHYKPREMTALQAAFDKANGGVKK